MVDDKVIVELFGIPRQRAGAAEVALAPGPLRQVLSDLERTCPGLHGLVQANDTLSPHYLLSLNGIAFVRDLTTPLPPGARVLLLSADLGG